MPLATDTVTPFVKVLPASVDLPPVVALLWQLGRACFVLLVCLSWAVGPFIATFLLLPPAHHLAVSTVSLAALLSNNRSGGRLHRACGVPQLAGCTSKGNTAASMRGMLAAMLDRVVRGLQRHRNEGANAGAGWLLPLPLLPHTCILCPCMCAVCRRFLAQSPSSVAVVDALDASLRALVMSAAPGAPGQMDATGSQATTRELRCMAGAAAIQVCGDQRVGLNPKGRDLLAGQGWIPGSLAGWRAGRQPGRRASRQANRQLG